MILKQGVIVIVAILLTFAGISYAADTHKGAVASNAMTMGHGAMAAGHGLRSAGHYRPSHHNWKDTLSKAQNEKMEAMHLSIKRDLAPLRAELEFKKAQLKNLVTTKAPAMSAIKAKINEISAVTEKILTKRYSHIVEMRKVLTPAQRQSFDLDFLSGIEHWQGHHKGH
jgi:Spy/CpxP family protein refolding chaperone